MKSGSVFLSSVILLVFTRILLSGMGPAVQADTLYDSL